MNSNAIHLAQLQTDFEAAVKEHLTSNIAHFFDYTEKVFWIANFTVCVDWKLRYGFNGIFIQSRLRYT